MPPLKDPFRNPTGVIPRVRAAVIGGGAAGNHTVAGINAELDRILSVRYFSFVLTEGTPNTFVTAGADLTSEFTITAANTINNTGGTATAAGWLLVEWEDHDWGETSNAPWNK